jgi:hypothetical protein
MASSAMPEPAAPAEGPAPGRHAARHLRAGRQAPKPAAPLPFAFADQPLCRRVGAMALATGAAASLVVAFSPWLPSVSLPHVGRRPPATVDTSGRNNTLPTGPSDSPTAAAASPSTSSGTASRQPPPSPSPGTSQKTPTPSSTTISRTTAPATAAEVVTGPMGSYLACATTTAASFAVTFTVTYDWHHVFINSDANNTTGYQDSDVAGNLGADYMVENGTLYRSTGTGWGWRTVSGVSPLVSTSGGRYSWQVPLAALSNPTRQLLVVFNGSGTHPDAFSPVITVGTCA